MANDIYDAAKVARIEAKTIDDLFSKFKNLKLESVNIEDLKVVSALSNYAFCETSLIELNKLSKSIASSTDLDRIEVMLQISKDYRLRTLAYFSCLKSSVELGVVNNTDKFAFHYTEH